MLPKIKKKIIFIKNNHSHSQVIIQKIQKTKIKFIQN